MLNKCVIYALYTGLDYQEGCEKSTVLDEQYTEAETENWVLELVPAGMFGRIHSIHCLCNRYPFRTSVVGSVRYRNGTAPPVHICKCIAHSVPIRSDPVFCGARSGTNCSGTVWSAQFVMWTGGSVPFRNKYRRTRFPTDPNCTGTVCTGALPLQMWTG